MGRSCTIAVAVLAVCVLTGSVGASGAVQVPARTDVGGLQVVERTTADGASPIEEAIRQLIAGPKAEETQAGMDPCVPAGTRLIEIDVSDDRVAIDFSAEVLIGLSEARLRALFDQVRAALFDYPEIRSFRLTCQGELLSSYLEPAPVVGRPAAPVPQIAADIDVVGLAGRNITIGPSHGRFWNGSGWYWQRSDPCGFGEAVLEDTNSIRLMQFLYQYLAQDGATVHVPRQLNEADCCHSGTGLAWWKMAAYSWLRYQGLPCSVWGSASGSCSSDTGTNRYSDDIRARPLFADYRGSDIYISHHTNAGGGGTANGTITFRDTAMEHPQHEAASYTLALRIQSSIVNTIREMYDAGWYNRGVGDSQGGFGEIRIPNRPACLVELAFHDNCSRDALYLTDDFFRSLTQWAIYKGVCDYFGVTPTWDKYSCEYVSDTIPSAMTPGQSYNVSVTFRNRGVLWRTARSFRLGAVGDSDPFTGFNRVDISGDVRPGNTYTFSFTMTAPSTPGTYTTDWRMVRDGVTWFGPTHSEQVMVGDVPDMPVITQHPTNQSVPEGSMVTFSVGASGQTPLSYQWYKGGVGMSNGGRIWGVTGASLQIAGVTPADQGSYQCMVTNTHGSASSNPASLTVTPNVFIVESRAGGQNTEKYSETGEWANSGSKSTAVGTTGGIGSRYGSTWRAAAGEKHALFNANLPAAGAYEVFPTWGNGGNRRSPILHRLTHAGGTTDVNIDQAATLNVWVSLGTFQFNAGTNVGQVDVNNLNIDTSGSMYADAVKWEYRGAVAPPAITQHPQTRNICPGSNTAMTVTSAGQGTLGYQWQKNGIDVSDGGHYSGATTATLSISSVDEGDAGNYRCAVFNGGGGAASNTASLTLKAATAITEHPMLQSVAEMGTAVFSVAALGEGTLAYRWQKDSVDLSDGGHYAGATTATLTISNCDSSDEGSYRCIVTGDCGEATSAEASLTITGPPSVPGDYDNDQDVDQTDFGHLQACLSGSGVPQLDEDCVSARLDGDSDVDECDLAIFLGCFSGPDTPGDPECANP